MSKKYSICLLLTILVLLSPAQTSHRLEYSKKGTAVWEVLADRRQITIPAPSGESAAVATLVVSGASRHVDLLIKTGNRSHAVNIGEGIGAELLWSHDGKAFFVNSSDVGRNGPYKVFVFRVLPSGLEFADVSESVEKAFHPKLRCHEQQSANVVGVGWIHDSQYVLVAAQVPHHSICENGGDFTLYKISLRDMKIVNSYSESQATHLFSDELGDELLRVARDKDAGTVKR